MSSLAIALMAVLRTPKKTDGMLLDVWIRPRHLSPGSESPGQPCDTPLSGLPGLVRSARTIIQRPNQCGEVADRPEVGQLVGVDDHVDARDPTVGDVQRPNADQLLLSV